ncbi:hypothetical protein STEG23_015203 [Scotinomys teguina]
MHSDEDAPPGGHTGKTRMCMCAHKVQKRELDPLELELKVIMWLNSFAKNPNENQIAQVTQFSFCSRVYIHLHGCSRSVEEDDSKKP